MLERIAGGDFSQTLANVAQLVSWNALPLLLVAYARQSLPARRLRPEFFLHKSEAAELDRALVLYRQVRRRLDEINNHCRTPGRYWRAVFAREPDPDRDDADEREDLEAHAHYLHATIVRLRRLPLERLRGFVRLMSLRSALGGAIAVYVAAFALTCLVFRFAEHPASAREVTAPNAAPLGWFPFDQSLFQANAGAACLAAILIPAFYLWRRRARRREFGLEFCVLKELAAMPPDEEIDRAAPGIDTAETAGCDADERAERWSTILGVAPSAGVDQVRDAYKALIKQSHPDRVQGLSPAIKQCAETETKRINAAYRQALASLN